MDLKDMTADQLPDSFSTRKRAGSAALRERNLRLENDILTCKIPKSGVNDETRKLQESIKRIHGIDIFNEKQFPVSGDYFSWTKLKEKLSSKMSEADAASSFTQFLRAGIQVLAGLRYQAVETTYEDWVATVPSSLDTELYAPNHGVAFPREVGRQMKYPEVGAAALDIKLKNKKFGSMYAVEQELLEDDQTGSFQRNSSLLGEYLKLLCEITVYGKLASVANMQYLDYSIPVSETKPSDEAAYPWSQTLIGGGANRPAAFGVMNQANIQAGMIAMMNQKNLLGIKMQVNPTRLLVSPYYKFDAAVLLNSAWYPSGAAAAGNTGGAFAINPIKGVLDVSVSRYMCDNLGSFNGNSKAWYLVDDTHAGWFVLQMRQPIAVVQENPQSGASFEQDVYRFKANTRKNADFIDPRFAWQGSNGSV